MSYRTECYFTCFTVSVFLWSALAFMVNHA
jgi:hypothetical protein